MKLAHWYRAGERGSVTLTWESAAATVLVLVGFGGVKYLTSTADCAQQEATDWVACSNVLDESCENTTPNCKIVANPEPDPCAADVKSRKTSFKTDNRMAGPDPDATVPKAPDEEVPAIPTDDDVAEPAVPADPCV